MAKKLSVADEVLAFVPQSNRHLKWWDKYAKSHGNILRGLLEARSEGGSLCDLPLRSAAKAMSGYLATKGIKIGEQAVERWLKTVLPQ